MKLNSQTIWVSVLIVVVILGLSIFVVLQINEGVDENTQSNLQVDQDEISSILPFDPEKEGLIEGVIITRNGQEITVDDSDKPLTLTQDTVIERITVNEASDLEDFTYEKEEISEQSLTVGTAIEVICDTPSSRTCTAKNILVQGEVTNQEELIFTNSDVEIYEEE